MKSYNYPGWKRFIAIVMILLMIVPSSGVAALAEEPAGDEENTVQADASEEDATSVSEASAENVDYGALAARTLRRGENREYPRTPGSGNPDRSTARAGRRQHGRGAGRYGNTGGEGTFFRRSRASRNSGNSG